MCSFTIIMGLPGFFSLEMIYKTFSIFSLLICISLDVLGLDDTLYLYRHCSQFSQLLLIQTHEQLGPHLKRDILRGGVNKFRITMLVSDLKKLIWRSSKRNIKVQVTIHWSYNWAFPFLGSLDSFCFRTDYQVHLIWKVP